MCVCNVSCIWSQTLCKVDHNYLDHFSLRAPHLHNANREGKSLLRMTHIPKDDNFQETGVSNNTWLFLSIDSKNNYWGARGRLLLLPYKYSQTGSFRQTPCTDVTIAIPPPRCASPKIFRVSRWVTTNVYTMDLNWFCPTMRTNFSSTNSTSNRWIQKRTSPRRNQHQLLSWSLATFIFYKTRIKRFGCIYVSSSVI